MSKFISNILLPILVSEAENISDEQLLSIKKSNLRPRINEEEEDDDSYWDDDDASKKIIENKLELSHLDVKLKEKSVEKYTMKPCINNCRRVEEDDSSKKITENKYEVKLREESVKKAVVETPFPLKSKKRKSCEKSKSNKGSSSRNEEKKKQKKKKKKEPKIKVNNGPESPPPLPIEFKNAIVELAQGTTVSEEKLVIQKTLFTTDTDKYQNRFSIPVNQIREEFLTEQEKINLTKYASISSTRKMAMEVKIIDPLLSVTTVELKNWEMKKYAGPSSFSYVLNKTWGEICTDNKLEKGSIVQLWAVRVDGELLFALVKLS
ncbi:putative B3 domain-containing protein [Abeliophyllum distichum]|uniref:B3 domain-containing protein n=1 Tax=Abeliophyllum distichum TaxID=126358 RepID=A0ABD1VY89_9LAMI